MYLLYMALCIFCTVIVYFFVSETKQIPLEEIAALFGDEIVVHLTDDGHGIVEKQLELSNAPIDSIADGQVYGKDSEGPATSVLHVRVIRIGSGQPEAVLGRPQDSGFGRSLRTRQLSIIAF